MSTKTVLEEQLHKLESEIAADEAWIEYVDRKSDEARDQVVDLAWRFGRLEAKLEAFEKNMNEFSELIDAVRS